MLKIIEANKLYFSLYFAFFILLFSYQLSFYQSDALIFLSNHRTAMADFSFKTITYLGEEWAFIGLTLFFYLAGNKKQAVKIACTGMSVLIVAQILKLIFAHDRPYTVFETGSVLNQIHLVEGYEILRGQNSFPSGHSAAGFALWTIMAFHFQKSKQAVVLLFSLAVLIGVSRVYLVAHFPEDVLLGSAIGVAIALIVQDFIDKNYTKRLQI